MHALDMIPVWKIPFLAVNGKGRREHHAPVAILPVGAVGTTLDVAVDWIMFVHDIDGTPFRRKFNVDSAATVKSREPSILHFVLFGTLFGCFLCLFDAKSAISILYGIYADVFEACTVIGLLVPVAFGVFEAIDALDNIDERASNSTLRVKPVLTIQITTQGLVYGNALGKIGRDDFKLAQTPLLRNGDCDCGANRENEFGYSLHGNQALGVFL
jgi:hypothetical protein